MNEKWFLRSVNEIETKLKTNAASGLSRKAARLRFSQKNGKLFFVPSRSPMSYVAEIVADFAYVMLLVMSFLALFFGENEIGTVTAVVLVVNLFVSFLLYYRSQFFCNSLEKVFLPRCRVVREGRVYSVSAEKVVPGDVILLQKGDIVPADARIVSSNKLKVRMLVDKDRYILLDKSADSTVPANENDPTGFSNVVHAASVVVSGTARVIATDVGQFTYVGAKMGALPSFPEDGGRVPGLLTLFKNYCRRLGIILMLVVLPFSIVSMLFGNTMLSLFVSFMTAIAIAATSMTQFALTVFKVFYTVSMKRCLSAYEPSLIRSPYVLDKLADVKYLFVLNNAILTDGILHFESSVTADGECEFCEGQKLGKAEKRLAELTALYDTARKTSLSVGTESSERFDGAIMEFIEKSAADRGALGIRCNITAFSAAATNGISAEDKLFYSEFGEKYMLSVSFTDSIINDCSYFVSDKGRALLEGAQALRLKNTFRSKLDAGKSVLVLSLSRLVGGEYCERAFVGMLVFGEAYDEKASEALSRLRRRGIKTVFFKDTLVGETRISSGLYPKELSGESEVTPDTFIKKGLPISYKLGGFSCYSGFDEKQISELIDAAHAQRCRVAVCGFDDRFSKIYEKADVYVSFSSSDYKLRGRFEEEIDTLYTYDDPARAEVIEVERRKAEVLIPRPDKKHGTDRRGGLFSLCSAFENAVSCTGRVVDFFRYLVCMQFTRLVLVMVPMLFGSTALDVRHIAFGGMISDLIVLIYYLTDKNMSSGKETYREAVFEMKYPLRQNAMRVSCFALGALFASLLPEVVSLFGGVPNYIDKTEYSLIVFILFHLAVFICLKFDLRLEVVLSKNGFVGKKPRLLGILYISLMAVFCLLCFAVPALSKLFDIQGFSSPIYLCLAFVPPLFSVIIYFFFGSFCLEYAPTSKKSKNRP